MKTMIIARCQINNTLIKCSFLQKYLHQTQIFVQYFLKKEKQTSFVFILIFSMYSGKSVFVQFAGPRNDFKLYVTPLTCSICSHVAQPKCNTFPSAGDTRQLFASIKRAFSFNDLVKNSAKLR